MHDSASDPTIPLHSTSTAPNHQPPTTTSAQDPASGSGPVNTSITETQDPNTHSTHAHASTTVKADPPPACDPEHSTAAPDPTPASNPTPMDATAAVQSPEETGTADLLTRREHLKGVVAGRSEVLKILIDQLRSLLDAASSWESHEAHIQGTRQQ